MRLPVEVLVLLCVLVGLFPTLVIGPAAGRRRAGGAVRRPVRAAAHYKLAIWHGFNLPLAMSMAATAGGVLLYFGLQRRVNLHRLVRLPGWIRSGGREAFDFLNHDKLNAARAVTDALEKPQPAALPVPARRGGPAGGTGAAPSSGSAATAASAAGTPLTFSVLVVWLIGVAAAVGTTLAYRRRLLALLLLGAVGLAVSLAFVYLSAPDLALTQLLVEMVTIILMMLALYWLPAESPRERGRARLARDLLLSLVAGAGVAALSYSLLTAASTRSRRTSCAQRWPRAAAPTSST